MTLIPARLALPALILLAWLPLREGLEANLQESAQRGLTSIIELTAADLERAGQPPAPRGASLIPLAAAGNPAWVRALRKAGEENRRHVYFFDARGHTFAVSGAAIRPTPGLVDAAAAARYAKPPPTQGARFDAYPGIDGVGAVGVWRWLPGLDLGVAAERPYARYALPLRALDALFATALLLPLGSWLWRRRQERARETSAPRRIGPYRIERPLGEGAMSHVYLASHLRLARRVALKRLKPQRGADEHLHRFEREARLAASLRHPHIVTVYDFGRARDGALFYTMEYVPGLTLTHWVEEHGPLPADRVIRLLTQLTDAIGALHERRLLHRDIKPDNIMAASDGEADSIKLLDFGLIRDLGASATRDLTRDLRVLGTPAYMAPERLENPRLVDPRSDLYGIGCVGFWLLTGRRPFEASLDSDLAQQVRFLPAPKVSGLAPAPVPEALERIIADCLAKNPAERPAHAGDLLERLRRAAEETPWDEAAAREWWRLRTCRTTP